MTKRKNRFSGGGLVWIILAGLTGLAFIIAVLLRGNDVALLNSQGLIAGEQARLMIVVAALMLEIAIPTLIIFYYFAWKYRESNTKAVHEPDLRHGKLFIVGLWAIPSTIVLLLAYIMWPATHKLAPQKSINPNVKPVTVQVVAMRWKWLFIYPEQNIATVNFVQLPVDTPVQFELTADETPMSSFWIPHLAGQLYAMTGHANRINVMAEEIGEYPGSSAEINGSGFAGMKFTAFVSSKEDFDSWVLDMQQSANVLSAAEYENLLSPSEYNPVVLYSKTVPNLYDNILLKYTGSHEHQPATDGDEH